MLDAYLKWTRYVANIGTFFQSNQLFHFFFSSKEQIQKLAAVIGLSPKAVKDPDPSYVLTVDNVIKVLAIVMRFRLLCIYTNYIM